MRHALEREPVCVAQVLRREGHGRGGVRNELERVGNGELVALRQHGAPIGRGALHDGADLRPGKVGGVCRILPRLTEIEPGAVRPVTDLQHLALPDRVERTAGDGIIERGAFSAGMISGLITEMKPAAKIITDIMEEADRAYADFKKIYG